MKSFTPLAFFLVLSLAQLQAQVTFTRDIAPIIYENCTPCHRPGEIGPMPFTSYNEVKSWGLMVEYVTDINYMPPWKADRQYSTFQGERFLSAAQKQLIKDWVADGMPEGNPNDEPPLPSFPTGSQIGQPDLVLSFSQAYEHKGNNKDQYQNFVLPTGLTQDRILKAIELRPGNSRIVHHGLFALDTTGNAQIMDSLSPEYGYDGFGGFLVDVVDNYPGYVPGAKSILYPFSIGQKMYANSDLLVQLHYAPISAPEKDSSIVNLFFADASEPISRQVMIALMHPFGPLSTLTNGPFVIQPNQVKTFHGVMSVPIDVSIMGIGPHMHLLGKDWTVYAVGPRGDTINLIRIPDWDFNWQGAYFFKNFQLIERGSTIHAYATYDNTSNNPLNPNNPPQRVSWGENTTDEMFYLPFLFVPTLPGDDTVNLEVALPDLAPELVKSRSSTHTADLLYVDTTTSSPTHSRGLLMPENKFYPAFPNPMHGPVNLGFSLAVPQQLNLSLYSLDGKLVEEVVQNRFFAQGHHKLVFNSQRYAKGIYMLSLEGKNVQMSQKIVIK